MQLRQLGSNLRVSSLGLGCMGMSEFYGPRDDTESRAVLSRAVDLGIDFFDTADMYGPFHNEELIGKFIADTKAQIKIATKFGIVRRPGEYARTLDNSANYARKSCIASLRRLKVDHIDLYYVHRINGDQPIEETIGGLSRLVEEGKIGAIGLSEVSAETLRRAHMVHPITAVQTEYSLWSRHVEAEILPTCRELGIGFVAYSPLGRGFLTGRYQANEDFPQDDFRSQLPRFSGSAFPSNRRIVDVISTMARDKGCTAAQLALAWLLAQGDDIVPIPGTKQVKYLEENADASNISLSAHDSSALNSAVDGLPIVGERYTEEGMKGLNV